MRKSSKLLFTGMAAAFLMAFAVGTASANHLSISSRLVIIRWTPLRFIAGSNTISCNVTLEGSFHSATIAKVNEALVGHISRGSVNSCTGGSATILNETLPWHVRYAGFTGTLPNITGINLRLISASFRVQPSGSVVCLARSTIENPARGIANENAATHVVRELTAESGAGIPLNGFLCEFAGEGHFEGVGALENGARASVTVTLI